MIRETLTEEMKTAGKELFGIVAPKIGAHSAMWVHSDELEDWRYYLITPRVATIGPRKLYRELLDLFQRAEFPKGMEIEDIHLAHSVDRFPRLTHGIDAFIYQPAR